MSRSCTSELPKTAYQDIHVWAEGNDGLRGEYYPVRVGWDFEKPAQPKVAGQLGDKTLVGSTYMTTAIIEGEWGTVVENDTKGYNYAFVACESTDAGAFERDGLYYRQAASGEYTTTATNNDLYGTLESQITTGKSYVKGNTNNIGSTYTTTATIGFFGNVDQTV